MFNFVVHCTVSSKPINHQRYLYRGYLQIACVDLIRSHHPCLWLITWDVTQPVAARPLAIQKDGTWYTYGIDLTKNVCEVFKNTGYIATAYSYSPFGSVISSGAVNQPLNWCSEFLDNELKLYYYNYRYYNARNGSFISRDPLPSTNMYRYVNNCPMSAVDILGLAVLSKHLEAADQYLNTLPPTLNGNNKKCFRYGNIYPDIPDSERIHINIPTYDIQIQPLIQGIPLAFITPLAFSTPQISREDFFAFLAENHLDQIPYVSDIKEFKKAIDEKKGALRQKSRVNDGEVSCLSLSRR